MLHPINWTLVLPYYVAAFAFGYLLGSIPFGLVITRLAGTGDIRAIGSGNIGATNVLRTGRKGLAALTLILDALKGTLAVIVADRYGGAGPAVRAALRPLVSARARLQGRQGRPDLYRPAVRARLEGRDRVLPGLARGGGRDPLLVPRRPRRQPRGAAVSVVRRLPAGGTAVRAAHRPDVGEAPRQYRAAACRNRRQDRPIGWDPVLVLDAGALVH